MIIAIDQYDQQILNRLLKEAIGNVKTGLEFKLLLNLLCMVNGMEVKDDEKVR